MKDGWEMNCYSKNCGKPIDDDSVYCKYCGVQQSVAQKIAMMKQAVAYGATPKAAAQQTSEQQAGMQHQVNQKAPATHPVAPEPEVKVEGDPEPPRFAVAPELPAVIFPETLTPVDDFFVHAGTLRIYKGNDPVVTVPAGVNSIGTDVFKDHKNLKEVYLPNGVNNISKGAFSGCTSLEKINFPEGLNSIGPNAFMDCTSLNNIVFPKSLLKILDKGFHGCTSLEEIYIPDACTTLSYHVFDGCTGLKKVHLPRPILTLFEGTFRGCTSLTGLELPPNLKNIEKHCFQASGLEYIVIPNSTIDVAEHAFSDIATLRGITVPKITKLHNSCFVNTNLINKGSIKYVMIEEM